MNLSEIDLKGFQDQCKIDD
jgi:hypothetical protein